MTTPPRPFTLAVNAWNPEYIEDLYRAYQKNPEDAPPEARSFFQGFDLARRSAEPTPAQTTTGAASPFQAAVGGLIDAYRRLGHIAAVTDPFGRTPARPAALALAHHALTDRDTERVAAAPVFGIPDSATLASIVEHLEATYCGSIGIEVMHVQNSEELDWLLRRIEQSRSRIPLTRGERVHILGQLLASELFEAFLAKRYPGDKRFSLEGAESTIPLLDRLIEAASALNVEEIVLGMAHRGRLNVLNNILGKTHAQIFTEFEENWDRDFADGGGDVKYHRGYSSTRKLRTGRSVHLAMASNPSHLESVNAVVSGRCRAKQRLRGDKERRRVIPVLVHGDAAISGQGMVAEVFNLSQIEGYCTGGTIHVVINNLIGFTTIPEDSRSSRYCTDIAKMVDAPVFHVNGEDPEACVAAAQIAVEYRQKFRKDVFIDMLCYRKYGHNEQDEASFTQPIMARLIARKQGVLRVYAERLLAEGVITEADMAVIRDQLDSTLEQAQSAARVSPYDPTIDPGSERWAGMQGGYTFDPAPTAVTREQLDEVCRGLARVPEGFGVNPKLKRLLDARASLMQTREISYADAESLAFGTLLLDGIAIRLSGQDCRRGTFSHRHAVLRDFESGEPCTPLNGMRPIWEPHTGPFDPQTQQARLCVYDSPLSEVSVLGFDYGYSLADPNMLVLWEAQFGDFANGAQVIIDQYIASAETKWERWSGLVMLLPHGYEGAGPEHSSCRIERYLDLCAGNNIQVAHPTTAAQLFHLLRRQVKRPFRKPLIIATPKSLLRTPTSMIEELTTGTFQEMVDDPAFAPDGFDPLGVRRVVLCSGKFYFELRDRRDAVQRRDIAIIRVEQLYPFNKGLLSRILSRYSGAKEHLWAQEEPRNAGAALWIMDRLREDLSISTRYVGRPASPTPAVGSKRVHKIEQETVLAAAIAPKPAAVHAPVAAH